MAGLLNPYQATPPQRAKKINAKWNGNTLTDAQGNTVMQAPGLLDAAEQINQFLPVTGDIQAGLLAANDVKQGNYGSAALNSLGLLPFVPALGGVVKNSDLLNTARQHFGVTFSPKETGYIVENPWSKSAERLDLSGRHQATGYIKGGSEYLPKYVPKSGQPDYLRYERGTDHREVADFMPTMGSQWETMAKFMDDTGAVRYMPDTGISLLNTNKPSKNQIKEIVQDFNRQGTPLIIDIDRFDNGENLVSKEFTNSDVDEVYKWLEKQYK